MPPQTMSKIIPTERIQYRIGRRPPRYLVPVYGELNAQSVTRPTLAVMTKEEVRDFNVPGLRISQKFTTLSGSNLSATLRKAVSAMHSRTINISVGGIQPVTAQWKGKPTDDIIQRWGKLRQLQRWKERGGIGRIQPCDQPKLEHPISTTLPDSRLIVIVVPESIGSEYEVTVKVRRRSSDEEEKTALDNKTVRKEEPDDGLLKAPLTDDLLIEAIVAADKGLTDGSHTGRAEWTEESERHERDFHVHHLMVCLFFYIYLHQLYANPKFYFDQRSAFFDYCKKRLPQDIDLYTPRYFAKSIKDLQVRESRFEDYVRDKDKTEPPYEKGKPSLLFWYDIYRRASEYFEQVLRP